MITALRAAARAMLGVGPGLCVDWTFALQGPLWPGEEADISRAGDKRRRDYTAGRTAARAALADLGLPLQPLARGPGGAVRWPDGITGSLSHCDDICIAAVARTDAVRSMGIDVERMQPLDSGMTAVICTGAEIQNLALSPAPDRQAIMIFSAKEAVFKAQYPVTGAMIGFHRVEITFANSGFEARFTASTGPFAAGHVLAGQQVTVQDHVLSSVMIRT